MKVVIMYRNTFIGGDGWTYHPMTVTIGENCPVCGCKRGEPKWLRFCEDGEWFSVNTWENSCGHVDSYKACYFEAKDLLNKEQEEDEDDFEEDPDPTCSACGYNYDNHMKGCPEDDSPYALLIRRGFD